MLIFEKIKEQIIAINGLMADAEIDNNAFKELNNLTVEIYQYISKLQGSAVTDLESLVKLPLDKAITEYLRSVKIITISNSSLVEIIEDKINELEDTYKIYLADDKDWEDNDFSAPIEQHSEDDLEAKDYDLISEDIRSDSTNSTDQNYRMSLVNLHAAFNLLSEAHIPEHLKEQVSKLLQANPNTQTLTAKFIYSNKDDEFKKHCKCYFFSKNDKKAILTQPVVVKLENQDIGSTSLGNALFVIKQYIDQDPALTRIIMPIGQVVNLSNNVTLRHFITLVIEKNDSEWKAKLIDSMSDPLLKKFISKIIYLNQHDEIRLMIKNFLGIKLDKTKYLGHQAMYDLQSCGAFTFKVIHHLLQNMELKLLEAINQIPKPSNSYGSAEDFLSHEAAQILKEYAKNHVATHGGEIGILDPLNNELNHPGYSKTKSFKCK